MLIHELQGEQLQLLPEKAVYWPAEKTLLIADSHLGKVRHFRKSGIAIPGKAAYENLQRLESLLLNFKPDQVIFLGDLFHSEMNYEWLEIKIFLQKFSEISFVLIEGNHDLLPEASYRQLEVHRKPLSYGPFLLSHEPLEISGSYNLCGHIHPGVRMTGMARQSMRLPCFFFGSHQAILPAFGSFTGLYLLKPGRQDQVFVVAGTKVMAAF